MTNTRTSDQKDSKSAAPLQPSVESIFGPIRKLLDENDAQLKRMANPKQTIEDINNQFSSTNTLDYDKQIPDKFSVNYPDDNVTIVIDESEPKLKALVATTQSFLKIFRTTEKRSLALAKLCVQRFGGGSEVPENVERYKAQIKTIRENAKIPASDPVAISLGSFIEVAGLDRHCALLYKYLADKMLGTDVAISASLSRRWMSDKIRTDVHVRIDGSDSDWLVDLFNNPPRLIRADTVGPNYGIERIGKTSVPTTASRPPQKAARIPYHSLLSSRVDTGRNEFSSIWNDARVNVHFSPVTPQPLKYDESLFTKEMDILATLLHPSIVRTRAISVNSNSSTIPALVMVRDPLEAQPLLDVLDPDRQKSKRWPLERILQVSVQTSEALSELHLFGLVYKELSAANILITPRGDAKLGNFQSSRYCLSSPAKANARYLAPELFIESGKDSKHSVEKNNPQFTTKSDVYAFGCVLYSLVTGKEPWEGLSDEAIQDKVKNKKELPLIPAEVKVDDRLATIIIRSLAHDPSARPSFEEIAATLKSILDATKRLVPVSQIAPFGFATLDKTNFGMGLGGGLVSGTSLVDSRDAIRLRQKLQPMSDDTVTVAREKYCSSIGMIDPYMIVAKRVDAPSFYVVHRPNGNVALVTCGLWDPNEIPQNSSSSVTNTASDNTPLPGIELLAEAKESDLGDLSNSWLYQCLLEVACTVKRNGTKLRRLLRERNFATMEVMDVKLPFEYLDPTTGRACMLLGIESPTVPKQFIAPNNTPVQIVTARLLTLKEWRDSQEFAVGKKPLAARFNRAGTHHVSSLTPTPTPGVTVTPNTAPTPGVNTIPAPTPSANNTPAPIVNGNDAKQQAMNNNSVKLPTAPILGPSLAWTVERLHQRLDALKESDNAKGSKSVLRTPVPYALGTTALPVPATLAQIRSATAAATAATAATAMSTSSTPPTAASLQRYSVPAATSATAANVTIPEASLKTPPLEAFENLGDISDYEPPIPTGVIVNGLQSGDIATTLSTIRAAIRKILAANSTASERLKTAAQTIYGALGTQSQLYGWQHVSEYIRNPQLYIERTKTAQRGGSSLSAAQAAAKAAAAVSARGPSELHEAIDTLQETGHNVVKRFIQRMQWLIAIFKREEAELTVETLLLLIGTDRRWMDDATGFMNSCEYKVAELLSKNPQRFNQFRDLQKKGVQWPHAPDLRRLLEKAGFTFRPMMIKRDRTVCDVCGAEVSGWRPWYEPRSFHDYSKHPYTFYLEQYPEHKSSGKPPEIDPITAPLLTGTRRIFYADAKNPEVNTVTISTTTAASSAAAVVTASPTIAAKKEKANTEKTVFTQTLASIEEDVNKEAANNMKK